MSQKKSRAFILSVGGVFVAVIAILTLYLVTHPTIFNLSPTKAPKTEMAQLRADLNKYIADKLQTERHGSRLDNVSILTPFVSNDGLLMVPYKLLYTLNDNKTLVEAVAVMKHEDAGWRILKVNTQKETVQFEKEAKVTADRG